MCKPAPFGGRSRELPTETGGPKVEAIPGPPASTPTSRGSRTCHQTDQLSLQCELTALHPVDLDHPPAPGPLPAHLDHDNSPSQRHSTSTPTLQSPPGTRILGTRQWGNKLAKLPGGLVIRAWPATTGSPADASTPAAEPPFQRRIATRNGHLWSTASARLQPRNLDFLDCDSPRAGIAIEWNSTPCLAITRPRLNQPVIRHCGTEEAEQAI